MNSFAYAQMSSGRTPRARWGLFSTPREKPLPPFGRESLFTESLISLAARISRATNPFSTRGEKRLAFGMLAISLKHCPSWEAALKKQKFWKTAILPCWTQSNRWFFILNTTAPSRFSKLASEGKSQADREPARKAPG